MIKKYLKKLKFPPFLSFFITKSGKINPSFKETMKDAEGSKNVWDRLNLQKTWRYFAVVFVMIFLKHANNLAAFIIKLIYQFNVLVFNGDGTPIVYRQKALLFYTNNIFYFLGVVALGYLLVTIIKKK